MNDLLKKQNWDRFLRFISTANVKGAFFSRFKKKNRHILKVFSIFFLIVLLLMEADISFAQTDSFLSKDSARILFIGNGNVGSEGGLHHHFRRTVAKADSSLSIQTDWLGMYDKPTLADMYTDDLVQRIKTGDDDLLVVSSGSSEAMHKFARLAQETEKKIVFFATWASNPLIDDGGLVNFREQTLANIKLVKQFEKETGIPVVPSGLIYYDLLVDPIPFWDLRDDYLFVPGSSVQNDLGTLVNVSAIYAVTTGKSPVGLSFWNPFPEKMVQAVQERVWAIVQKWKNGKFTVKELPQPDTAPKWPSLVKNDDHIFYVGNSYIGTEGGLDNHFARMVQQMNPSLQVHNKSMIYWGQGLSRMYTDNVVNEINTGENDLVVVTSGPLEILNKFHNTIEKAGSKMMVHMTWGLNPTLIEGKDLSEYREQTVRLVNQMKKFEKEKGVPIAPCGLVFYDLIVDPPQVDGLRLDWVYMVENIHQNHIGTMSNAAVHYAVMTGRSPVGLQMWDPYPPELVKAVQERAWKIVQDWKADKTVIKLTPERRALENRFAQMRKNVKWVNPNIKDMSGLSHYVLQSSALGQDVGYAVWLPPGYTKKAKKRFPVVYFLHGAGGNESADAAGFSGWVAKAIDDGLLPEVICVFPNGGMSFYRGDVEKMIIGELVPTIDKDYRTIADAGSRVLAGFSMGGFGSVRFSVMHPELFCAAASMGGGLWGIDEQFLKEIERAVPVWKNNEYGFFLVNGDNDRPDAFKDFSETLTQKGIENQIVILPDTKHNLGHYYERSAPKLLEFLGNHLKKTNHE